MGFIDLSITGNDEASNLEAQLQQTAPDFRREFLIKICNEESPSRFNTPGWINTIIVATYSEIKFSNSFDSLLCQLYVALNQTITEGKIDADFTDMLKKLRTDFQARYGSRLSGVPG